MAEPPYRLRHQREETPVGDLARPGEVLLEVGKAATTVAGRVDPDREQAGRRQPAEVWQLVTRVDREAVIPGTVGNGREAPAACTSSAGAGPRNRGSIS
jgi:hypothetical protein